MLVQGPYSQHSEEGMIVIARKQCRYSLWDEVRGGDDLGAEMIMSARCSYMDPIVSSARQE